MMRQASEAKKKKNISAIKLNNKRMALAIKTDDSKQAQGRYYHICCDKLADAFEKQFIIGLPDFALYSKNDQKQT